MRPSDASRRAVAVLAIGALAAAACSGPPAEGSLNPAAAGADTAPVTTTESPDPTNIGSIVPAADQGLPAELAPLNEAWTGDFDGMVERRVIRILVVFSKMLYFLDGAEQRGVTYEATKLFEEHVNDLLDTGTLKVHVLLIPVTRDRLIPALEEGLGDIAAANLTITAERLEHVDFSHPLASNIREVVVTGPSAPALRGLEDLSGREIPVRRSSSYYGSLVRLNESLQARGLEPVTLSPSPEHLEDEDLLEMVNAGLLPMIIVDSHKAEFWAQIFEDITVRDDLSVNVGGDIAWAFRKDSPQLSEVINDFVEENKQGTLMGNILLRRYLKDTDWVENSYAANELERFRETVDYFRNYADIYDFDWLMVAAQAYQESRLDQSARSRAGAIGVMQVLPSTAADPNVGIPDIEVLENNIHAGVKYLRFLLDRYFAEEDMDRLNQALFAFAAYNAGPARVAGLRRKAEEMGLDPDVWFGNVEVVAAREIGRETVQYVSNIYKYYVAYRLIADRIIAR